MVSSDLAPALLSSCILPPLSSGFKIKLAELDKRNSVVAYDKEFGQF